MATRSEGAGTGSTPPPWWENDAEVDAFAERHRGRLIDKLGLSDLFATSPEKKEPPRKGGGQEVARGDMEGAMSSLVTALTKGIEMGATVGAASNKGNEHKRRVIHNWFFGDTEVEG